MLFFAERRKATKVLRQLRREVEPNKTTATQSWSSARPMNIEQFVRISVKETLSHLTQEIHR
jgi:hypothetical protein